MKNPEPIKDYLEWVDPYVGEDLESPAPSISHSLRRLSIWVAPSIFTFFLFFLLWLLRSPDPVFYLAWASVNAISISFGSLDAFLRERSLRQNTFSKTNWVIYFFFAQLGLTTLSFLVTGLAFFFISNS